MCEDNLDEYEQKCIKEYADDGYQLRNKTSGSQGKGKRSLDNQKSPKGYYDGLQQGYKNAQKFVANLFDKHLFYDKKSDKPNKNQEKALEKFREFLDWSNE
jgi:4-hydroxyphenylpyruvate dioxygenase-like putative hemolysin